MDFCPKHHVDTYLCQVCGKIHCEMCDGANSTWTQIPRADKGVKGNICPSCMKAGLQTDPPIGLFEHCRRESGLTNHVEITRYMNRHYGFG